MKESDSYRAGFDSYIGTWERLGRHPGVNDCPARYMEAGSRERHDFISGWLDARDEALRE